MLDVLERVRTGFYRDSHTQECIEETERIAHLEEHWMTTWPDHCVKCMGAGEFNYPGTRLDPPSSEYCDCTEQFECPRCRGKLETRTYTHKDWLTGDEIEVEDYADGDPVPCPHCGWNWGNGYSDVCPRQDYCVCGLEYDDAL